MSRTSAESQPVFLNAKPLRPRYTFIQHPGPRRILLISRSLAEKKEQLNRDGEATYVNVNQHRPTEGKRGEVKKSKKSNENSGKESKQRKRNIVDRKSGEPRNSQLISLSSELHDVKHRNISIDEKRKEHQPTESPKFLTIGLSPKDPHSKNEKRHYQLEAPKFSANQFVP